MRLGIAQIDTVAGAFSQTVEHMVAQSQRAAEQGVELLVFPLAALAGTEPVPYADRPSFQADVADALAVLADRLACPCLLAAPNGLSWQENGFDVLLAEQGEVRPVRVGSAYAMASAKDREVATFDFGSAHLALALSYADLDALDDYDYEVDVVVCLGGYSFALDDPSSAMGADLDEARYVPDAQAMGAWLVGAAGVGCYGDEVLSGSSFVLAPSGELAMLAPSFEEALLVCDLALPAPERLPSPSYPEPYDAPFHLWQALALGIHGYATKNGYQDVALVLDGSLDALVLAALATDAMGPLHVHALVGASAAAVAPACRELVRRLRINGRDAAGHPQSLDARDLDELELAALAREHGALVLSSWDKTGLALGAYAGRVSAAQLCPLGDVYRSDVLDMAHVRNTISPLFRRVSLGEADAIVLPVPTGGQIRLSGESDIAKVDEILLGYVEYDRSRLELLRDEVLQGELIDAVLRAERACEVWRRSAPPVLAMSTHTLDDARFPLGVRWHDEREMLPDRFLPDAPSPTPEEVREVAPEGQRGQGTPTSLEATLAMLRDLAEQGGFMQGEAMPRFEVREADAAELWRKGYPSGWMSPFSEN